MMSPVNPSFGPIAAVLDIHVPDRVDDADRARAAVALVLTESNDGPSLLVIRRAIREGDPWSGQMALPGGRFETEDGSLLETAMRETQEETGVHTDKTDCLGELSDLAPTSPGLPPIAVRPFVFGLLEKPLVTLNPEADRYIWVPLKSLRSSRKRSRVKVRGHHLLVESFLVEGEIIWGMTERIIMLFLDLVNI
jgi:8-oxo-dGTP pyrophosphatase MutT (NUDIX family)